jgi:hypothetical protein
MTVSARRACGIAAWSGAAIFAVAPVHAGVFLDDDQIMVQAAPDTVHFHHDAAHARYSWLVGAEWQRADHWLAGYAYFNNSFNQKSHYLYGGKWWGLGPDNSHWYLKLTGGVIAGYKEPYEDKIPFNHNGVAPGFIPGIGYRHERFNAQMNLLGKAGLMFTVGCDLIR